MPVASSGVIVAARRLRSVALSDAAFSASRARRVSASRWRVVRVVIFASREAARQVASAAVRWAERRSDSRRVMRGSVGGDGEDCWSGFWEEGDWVERVSRRVVSSVVAESAVDCVVAREVSSSVMRVVAVFRECLRFDISSSRASRAELFVASCDVRSSVSVGDGVGAVDVRRLAAAVD